MGPYSFASPVCTGFACGLVENSIPHKMVFDKAKEKIKPLPSDSRKNARPSWPPLRGGSARRRWGREPCGGQEYFGLRLAKTLVGASIARPCPLALQENCPGKCVAAVSWRATNGRPYTRNKAGMQFFDSLRSGQDRSLQISRQHCGGYNKVGGNKKSHHGRWWERQSVSISQPR